MQKITNFKILGSLLMMGILELLLQDLLLWKLWNLQINGQVGTIIVKNHSRLGRNRLVVGQLLEEDFVRVVHRIDELIKKLREEYK